MQAVIAEDEDGAELQPPWPNMVRLPAAIVNVPAGALWPEHESYAAACWIERDAVVAGEADGDDGAAMAPTVAQLVLGLGSGALRPAATAELTSSAIAMAVLEGGREAERAELQLGAGNVVHVVGAVGAGGARAARRAVLLEEPRRQWRQLVRPCAPRTGHGEQWPAVCERLGRGVEEPVLLDRGDMVAQVHEADGWTLVAAGAEDHALSWVPSDALDEWVDEWVGAWLPAEGDEGRDALDENLDAALIGFDDDLDGGRLRVELIDRGDGSRPRSSRAPRPAGEPPPAARKLRREVSDAPLLDAILALAESAAARLTVREARGHAPPAVSLSASAELWPSLVAELLEAWTEAGLAEDERLAALSAIDVVLLAVAVAPALDRATARRYRGFASPGEPFTAGLAIDLAGGSAATRVRLGRRLARDLPLRAGEVVLAGAGQIPAATAELMVAPWVVAACYGT